MSAPVDEMADLRRALLAGDWRRLEDPRLELAVLDDLSAWSSIVKACASRVTIDALQSNNASSVPVELLTWYWDEGWPEPLDGRQHAARMPRRHDERVVHSVVQLVLKRFPDHARATASLRLARHVVTRWPQPDLEMALGVLARWPAG